MIANYHTHTTRCRHASGTEEAYVQAAIQGGLEILGFSDHTPYWFPEGYYTHMRMYPYELPLYCNTVRELQRTYADQLQIHLGLEVEYYPAFFGDLLPRLRDQGIEYMILGQHHIGNELGEPHCAKPTEDKQVLQRYCDQVIAGMETGLFTYLAHPDFINFVGDPKVYLQHMRRLCHTAKECGIPMEINMLGLRQNRHYPSDRFFALVAEEGCPVVIGSDAHKPEQVLLPDNEAQALEIVSRFGLTLITEPKIRKI